MAAKNKKVDESNTDKFIKNILSSENEFDLQNILYKIIFEQIPIGIAISYNCYPTELIDNNQASINPMYEQITGRNKEEMVKLGWAKITHPDDLQENLDYYNELLKGNINGYSMEKRFIKPDGSIVWVDMTVAKLNHKNISKYNHISLVQDITERKSIENALYESERSKSVLLSNLPGMAYRCNFDRNWTMKFVSKGCYELLGYKSSSLINNKDLSFNDLIAPEYHEALWNEWVRILSNILPFRYEYEIITATGQRKWILELGQGIYDEKCNVVALEGIIIDISDRKEHENKLKYNSEHYELTGLYNRRFFDDLLVKESIERKNGNRAILLINLKKINSVSLTYGYNFSKNLIKELAEKLYRLKNDNRKLFQISFERFAFYIREYESKCELSDFCNEIFNVIKEVQILNNIGCSVGILEIEQNNWDSESIIKNASVASERANDKSIFEFCYYDEELKAKVTRENDIKDELFKIIVQEDNNSIYLQYQPILDLRTNEISEFEALARFKSEKLGLVPPIEFIPIAEEMQLIVPIGARVIHMACKFIKKLESAGYDNISVSVNVSGIQLMRDEFISDLEVLIKNSEIKTQNLGIEITESIFLDSFEIVNEKLCKLKEMGIKVSIDDFGTGYSSLSRESELNVDCLKIDKYFIDRILKLNPEQAITGDIISMAHKLGHLVVAEGVEYEKQYQYLVDNNCDFIQGYLFSKPLNEVDALEMLKNINR